MKNPARALRKERESDTLRDTPIRMKGSQWGKASTTFPSNTNDEAHIDERDPAKGVTKVPRHLLFVWWRTYGRKSLVEEATDQGISFRKTFEGLKRRRDISKKLYEEGHLTKKMETKFVREVHLWK